MYKHVQGTLTHQEVGCEAGDERGEGRWQRSPERLCVSINILLASLIHRQDRHAPQFTPAVFTSFAPASGHAPASIRSCRCRPTLRFACGRAFPVWLPQTWHWSQLHHSWLTSPSLSHAFSMLSTLPPLFLPFLVFLTALAGPWRCREQYRSASFFPQMGGPSLYLFPFQSLLSPRGTRQRGAEELHSAKAGKQRFSLKMQMWLIKSD